LWGVRFALGLAKSPRRLTYSDFPSKAGKGRVWK
jgi:hypothetical protein